MCRKFKQQSMEERANWLQAEAKFGRGAFRAGSMKGQVIGLN